MGGTHDHIRARRLGYIFSSFPHVSEVRFLTAGLPGLHFMSAGPSDRKYRIFNADQRMPTHICDLAIDDPWINEDWWRIECE